MEDGWTEVSYGKNVPSYGKNVPKNNKSVEKKEEEPRPVLNKVFDMPQSSSDIDSSEWKTSSDVDTSASEWKMAKPKRRKNQQKPEKAEEKKEETQKKKAKKPKKEKTPTQILREKDERRARQEMKSGDKLLFYYPFVQQNVEAKVITSTKDTLTFTWDGYQQVMDRNDRRITPIWNKRTNCYFPLPKKEKKKKTAAEPEPKKEKKKKAKKKGPKKLVSETAILNQISTIIQHNGKADKLGLPEIMNHLRDHLQGGSWNQKKYKGKFGTMKKFLQKHSDRFIIEVVNGNVEITRLPPPPPKLKKDPSVRASTPRPGTPRGSGGNIYVFMFILLALLILTACIFFQEEAMETLKKIQGRLQEQFFTPSSATKEL